MTWDEKLAEVSKIVDLAIKAEIHAFALIGMGLLLTFHGQKEQGTALITLGAGVFKGNR
jgi:hypothetical protein